MNLFHVLIYLYCMLKLNIKKGSFFGQDDVDILSILKIIK